MQLALILCCLSLYSISILNSHGQIYSYGKSNICGQLGLGDNSPRCIPTRISSLENERVISISSGFKHSICKTGLGKIFTWGNNCCGQLGIGNFENKNQPILLNTESFLPPGSKPLQIRANFSSSLLLAEPDKVYWWGKNCHLKNEPSPIEINFGDILKIKDKEQLDNLIPLKIITKFSQTMSVTAISIANTFKIPEPKYVKAKICNTLTSKWDYDTVHPPIIDSVTKHFSFSQLDKTLLSKKDSESKKINQTEVVNSEESDILMKFFDMFLNENTKKRLDNIQSPRLKTRLASPKRFAKNTLDQLSDKVFLIKEKVFTLMNMDRKDWNYNDEQFMKNISDQKFQQILKKF